MTNQQPFRQELESIARPADQALRATHEKAEVAAAWPRAIPWILAVPLLYGALCMGLRAEGVPFDLPLWMIGLISLVPPAVYLLNAGLDEKRLVSEAEALALVDDRQQLQDRMSTAREFLDTADRTPFMEAAIQDAEAHADRARAFAATAQPVPARLGVRHLAWPAGAVVLVLLTGLIEVRDPTVTANEPSARRTAVAPESEEDKPATPDTNRTAKPDNTPKVRKESSREPNPDASKRGDSGTTNKNRKKTRGDQGKGKSSQAESSSGRSTGEGQATDQAQPTKAAKKRPAKPKKEKPPKPGKRKKKKSLPMNDEKSMASSGQGKGRGSSRSPTASEWSSKDQSVADDEEELEDEDEVDDEDEESEARGGLQPSLRQRKPPVNRDLNIGFGGGKPPPHANGRGGPGLPKKQRGVAQLVLGIPYPDQIAGQPNPGRTKVTQERIEPQPQTADPVAAEARPKRSAPMGHLEKPVLLPWMQDLVRAFQESQKPTKSPQPSK